MTTPPAKRIATTVVPCTISSGSPDALDRLVEEQVLRPFDHKYLNSESAAFQQLVPTTENLAREIYARLQASWNSVFPGTWPVLDKVRIAETPRNIFEVSETNG
jgi:6-pyruvoyltetrahydropterin/6-carboxytetrahydropterin synthase